MHEYFWLMSVILPDMRLFDLFCQILLSAWVFFSTPQLPKRLTRNWWLYQLGKLIGWLCYLSPNQWHRRWPNGDDDEAYTSLANCVSPGLASIQSCCGLAGHRTRVSFVCVKHLHCCRMRQLYFWHETFKMRPNSLYWA